MRAVDPRDYREQLLATFAFPGSYEPVSAALPWQERLSVIRANYRRKQAMVKAGLDDWFMSDPYEIADWTALFTPIERAVWSDIRSRGLDLWPQLPVGRFFVDFGNPVAKVAIECDGFQWHQDTAKDAARDQQMQAKGWTVLRIPGWQCNSRILSRQEAEEAGIENYAEWLEQNTPFAALMAAKRCLDSCSREGQ